MVSANGLRDTESKALLPLLHLLHLHDRDAYSVRYVRMALMRSQEFVRARVAASSISPSIHPAVRRRIVSFALVAHRCERLRTLQTIFRYHIT